MDFAKETEEVDNIKKRMTKRINTIQDKGSSEEMQ